MSFESSGAEYLRRLRSQESPGVAHEAPRDPAAPKPVPAQDTTAAGERRRSPRYKCEGSAEFRVEGSDVRTWGTFTDISMTGCYVEMMATFPVGSRVDLALELQGVRVQVQGEVRVSYPCLGMGIAFTEITDQFSKRLRDVIGTLAPPSLSQGTETSAAAPSSLALPQVVNPAAALQALVDFFEQRGLLTKEEFVEVLRKSQGV